MDTQILKLEPPFEYIHCNGSTALHIATMIVYEAKTNENGEYELITHSHPIVKYFNTPGMQSGRYAIVVEEIQNNSQSSPA